MRFELNLDVGKPVAYVEGGALNGQIVHVVDVDKEEYSDDSRTVMSDETELLIKNFFSKIKQKLNFVKMNQLQRAINTRERPEDPVLGEVYDDAMMLIDGSRGKELIIKPGGRMRLLFDPNTERLVFFIAGMSGSGKSTIAGELVDNYHRIYPKNEIYLFSNKPEDPALDKHKNIIRVPLDEYLADIDLEMMRDSLVIFDDIEGVQDRKLENGNRLTTEIERVSNLILQQGRSYHTSFIYISHLANDYRRTKIILTEAHSITVFPQMSSSYSIEYLLTKYLGFGKQDVARVLALPSRAVTIYKAPITVIHERGVYLLK